MTKPELAEKIYELWITEASAIADMRYPKGKSAKRRIFLLINGLLFAAIFPKLIAILAEDSNDAYT